MGSLLGKIYPGLLYMWVAVAEIGMNTMSRWPISLKPWVAKYFADEITRVAGCRQLYCKQ